MTLEEVRQLRVDGEPVPTLEEMLYASRDRVTLFVELKGETADERMADDAVRIIKEMGMEKQAVLISLKYDVLAYIEENYPEMKTGYLAFFSFGNIENIPFDYFALEEEISTAEAIEAIHDKGKKVMVWTVNESDSIEHFLLSSADTIITDQVKESLKIKAELMKLNEKLNQYNNFPQRDGRVIPTDPYLSYEKGYTADIDLMIGTNAQEMNYWIGEIGGIVPFRFSIPVKFENDMKHLPAADKKRVKQFMGSMKDHSMWRMARFYDEMMFRLPAIEQAQAHAANGGRSYMYYWTVPSVLPLRKACHAVELAYVFGNLEETIYTGEIADETLSDTVMQMWTNFARTGDPSVDDLVWEPYKAQSRATMIISRQPHIEYDVLSERRRLLFPLLRHMINPSYATLDYNVPFVRKAIAGGLALAAGVAGLTLLAVKLLNRD